ncbi:RNA-binding protein [Salix suchowensis]|nr:RNA-binding protein [Salix suchowensis]
MADSYWRYAGDSRQPPPQSMSSLTGKRPRIDYDIPSSRDLSSFYSRDDDRGALQVIRDSDSIGASYDRYLRSGTARAMSGVPSDDTHLVSMGPMEPGASVKDRSLRMESGRPEVSLPPDASSTLFVEGLPSDCTRREVSHIFRPFVGYKEVRLVSKESRHPGGDLLVLCFVDFLSPAHAATAMDALQGYRFDDHDRDSFHLRLQFARYPGARSGGGHRGKR